MNKVFMHGNPLTLVGDMIKVGDKAPNFEAINNDLKLVKLSDYAGKTVIISSVPSLDTPTCDLQTRRFNGEALKMNNDTVVLTLSMDLPFAQKRWCGNAGVERVITLSDHKNADFGKKYGLLIDELRLLARTVMVIDKDGVVRYLQVVNELSEEPDYNDVLKNIPQMV